MKILPRSTVSVIQPLDNRGLWTDEVELRVNTKL